MNHKTQYYYQNAIDSYIAHYESGHAILIITRNISFQDTL